MKAYDLSEMDESEGAYERLIAALGKDEEGGAGGHRAVLIADDEKSVRRMVSRSMTQLDPDLKVYQAENGREALETLQKLREKEGRDPVLIVTDLQMPVMDGWEFIEALREEYEAEGKQIGIPLVVLSSSTGTKGFIAGKSVHGDKSKYQPLVTVAKEDCIKPMKYDAQGEQGLVAWVKFFLKP